MKETPTQSENPKKKLWSPKNSQKSPKRGTPLKIGVETKFSNFDPKFDLYGALTPAEYESGVRKILKIFPGTLESQKDSRHFAKLAITFWDSSGPPTYYTFFGAPEDSLSNWLSKRPETTL